MKTLLMILILVLVALPAYGQSIDACAFNKNYLWEGLMPYSGSSNKIERINDVIANGGLYFDNKLTVSVWFGYDKIIMEQLANSKILATYGAQSLYVAAAMGRLTEMSMLLEAGVPANAKVTYEAGGHATPIYGAAQNGCVQAIQLLVKHGASVNYKTHARLTLLELAVGGGHLRAARYLLTHGYNVGTDEKVRVNKILKNIGMVPGLRAIFWQADTQPGKRHSKGYQIKKNSIKKGTYRKGDIGN